MLKIRMQRIGRTNMPAYRLIVAEHTRSPKTGNIVEKVGTYNPKTKERKLNAERIKYWISVGAQASGTVHNMLVSAGIIAGKKINVLPKKSPPTKTAESSSSDSSQSEEFRKVETSEGEAPAAAVPETPAEAPADAPATSEEAPQESEALAAEEKAAADAKT